MKCCLGILMLAICFSGCSVHQYIYKPPELVKTMATRLSPEEMKNLEIPYEASEEMILFAENAVENEINPIDKSISIVNAIMSKWKLDVTYERTADFSAREIFYSTRRANCLAFTHLFISLARSVGIRAHYVDVKFEELIKQNEVVISNHHICAGIYDGTEFFLIDFDPNPQKNYRVFRLIDDIEALANHYNNIAINQLSDTSDSQIEALRLLNITLKIQPNFTRAINNKGAILSLLGYNSEAIACFRQAVKLKPNMPEANSNLSGILLKTGNVIESLKYIKQAVKYKPGSLFYRRRLAMIYMQLDDFNHAFKEFRWLTRQNPDCADAYKGMASALYHLGNYSKAHKHASKALSLNPDSKETQGLLLLIESLKNAD